MKNDPALVVDHKNSVQRRVGLSFQERGLKAQLLLRLAALGDFGGKILIGSFKGSGALLYFELEVFV